MLKISVPDMSCEHCKRTLSTLLSTIKGVDSFEVDLDSKQIRIEGDVDWDRVETAIKDAGYTPERIDA